MRSRFTLLFFILATFCMLGQKSDYYRYIDKYKHYAIDEMKRYGIPASITLAQGLLESGAGKSTLATKANNHFGIKTGPNWKGPYILRDDDLPNEKFRVYKSAKDSYEDHSKFLYGKPRYASLFKLSTRDYKGWAHGLKKAGYATNPGYAYLLIDLIERYDLTQYDGKKYKHKSRSKKADPFEEHPIHMCNNTYYIFANPGDTYKSLSKLLKKSERKLRKYNEVDKHYELSTGDIVYLGKKESKADKRWKGYFHKIMPGESIYTISQKYGVRIKTLYDINYLKPSHVPTVGDLLLIR